MKFLKDMLQSLLWNNGFTIQRIREFPENNINLLKLLLDRLPDDTSNFTVVQVGANDGKTQDPVHPLIMRGGWSGILVEPIPNLFGRLSAYRFPCLRCRTFKVYKLERSRMSKR